MSTTSSYLKYLPPVLWSTQTAAGPFDLGKMLSVFQKILTGIDDGVVITHGDNSVMTTVVQPGLWPRLLKVAAASCIDRPDIEKRSAAMAHAANLQNPSSVLY